MLLKTGFCLWSIPHVCFGLTPWVILFWTALLATLHGLARSVQTYGPTIPPGCIRLLAVRCCLSSSTAGGTAGTSGSEPCLHSSSLATLHMHDPALHSFASTALHSAAA